jgi:hypothetical protein
MLPLSAGRQGYGFWIGLRDRKDQTFRWEDNRAVTYIPWQMNEPQGFTTYHEGCTFINAIVSGKYTLQKLSPEETYQCL